MKKSNIYSFYKCFVIVVAAITVLLCTLKGQENGYGMMATIPIVYLIIFLINRPLHYYSKNYVGMLMINMIMFFKYIVAVLLIVVTDDYSLPSAYQRFISEESNSQAILMLLAEMVSISLIIYLFAPIIYSKKEIKDKITNHKEQNENSIAKRIIFYIIVIAGIVAIILEPEKFLPKQLVYMGDDFELDAQSGLLTIVLHVFKLTTISFFIDKLIDRYMKTKKPFLIVVAYALILLLCLLNTGRSRTLMMIPLLLFVLITHHIFNKKITFIIMVVVVAVLSINLTAVSNYKYSWQTEERSFLQKIINTGDSLQEYTSNIRPTAAAIETNSYYKDRVGLRIFLNDTLGSIPIINHYVNKDDRYNVYYNYFILAKKQTSKIAPLTGYSASYFGKYGCFILSGLFVVFLMVFDKNKNSYKIERNFLSVYNSYYLLFILADSICSSYQSVIGRIFTLYVPIKIVELLMRVNFNKKENNHVK